MLGLRGEIGDTFPRSMAEESEPQNDEQNFREKLWKIVFEAETPAGHAFDVVLLVAIGMSVAAVMLESVDGINEKWAHQLHILEWFFTILFTLEYMMRLWLVRRSVRYATSFFGIVDLLSCLPTYLAVLIPGAQSLLVIRILRLLRMFRVLKMVHHVRGADVIMRGLAASRAKITVFFFTMLVFAVIVGTITYLVETDHNHKQFSDIPSSIYWAIVTMMTLGYGDMAPVTVFGKFIASFTVLTGYAVIAVPTGIVSAEMARASRQNETTAACESCGCHGHLPDAKFCRRCGETMK